MRSEHREHLGVWQVFHKDHNIYAAGTPRTPGTPKSKVVVDAKHDGF
jgi:hypothetical protein